MDGQKKLVIEFTPEEELDDLIRRLPRGGTKGCRQRWTKKMLDVWLPIIAIQKEQKKSEQVEARRTRKEEEEREERARRWEEKQEAGRIKMEARKREYREFREEESRRERERERKWAEEDKTADVETFERPVKLWSNPY